MTWEQFYDLLGIKEFVYFISSPAIQDALLPIKLVFIFFAAFFLCAVVYFYFNSSYIQRQFLQDTKEFFTWSAYAGGKQAGRRWKKITRKVEIGGESQNKLAVIEADDLLYQTLVDEGYKGETFDALVNDAAMRVNLDASALLGAHEIRDSIVYDSAYRLTNDKAKKVLADYEKALKAIISA